MLQFGITLSMIVVMGLVYFGLIRPWVRSQSPWMASKYDQLDSIYARLWMLMQRAWGTTLLYLALILPDIAQFLTDIGAIDFSSILPNHIALRVTQAIAIAGTIVRFMILRIKTKSDQP